MAKKTTNKTTISKTTDTRIVQFPGKPWKAPEADNNDVLHGRIVKDIEALATASEVQTPDGKASRARILWYALAAYLADEGILEHLNAAAAYMLAKGKNPSPEQFVSAVPMGEAMHLFFDGATDRDFQLKNKLVDAMIEGTDNVEDRYTGRHWGMAVTDLARVAYLNEMDERGA